MKRRAASKKVCAFLVALTVCLPLIVAGIRSASASTSISILADGEINPATAPISTLDNITYVFTGNINVPISIERSGITLDGKMYMLKGTGSGNGITLAHIEGVTIKNIDISGFSNGIQFSGSSNNTIEGNLIHSNIGGIALYSSSNNEIFRNAVYSNTVGGLNLEDESTANVVTENNITSNGHWGIYCDSSSNNYFYHNIFLSNPIQAGMFTQSVDTWDDGYPSGGNYWSDYNGTDQYSGPYQNVTGRDGIGDTPYIIDSSNQDNYPLMNVSEALHNIAVTQVTPWQNLVMYGQILNITVSVQNTGIYNETFNLTLAANTTTLETLTLTLHGLSSANSVFSWNTTNSPTGNYTFTATAGPVPGETNVQDNVLTSGIVTLYGTQLEVDPLSISVPIGQVFCVNVTLTDVYNDTGWQVWLYYNSTVLNCTGVTEGPFLQTAGTTSFNVNINNAYNTTYGCIQVWDNLTGQNSWVSGDGVLAIFTFTALTAGSTTLHLSNTELDDNSLPINRIPCTTIDGFAAVTEAGFEVDPSPFVAPVNYDIYFNIILTNANNVTAWSFGLFYDSTVLNCIGVTEGPFLQTPQFMHSINNAYNTTEGYISAGDYFTGTNFGVSGNGTLAIIEFTSLNIGNTSLCFNSTETLLDGPGYPVPLIPCTTTDGFVTVVPAAHDLAVEQVGLYKTIVGRNYLENITVTVENLGTFDETFNLTIYANDSAIVTETVSLASLDLTTLTYSWNTTGFAYGNYTISAYAWPVPGETNTANNNCTGGWVIVSIPGDITGPNGWPDGKVDMRDIAYVARRFMCKPGDSLWDPNADINDDGKIDMIDIAIAARNFGATY
jgi:parallel beta-helix repeat protein